MMLSIFRFTLPSLSLLILCACSQQVSLPPNAADIESIGLQALHGKNREAIKTLKAWAQEGNVTAQRELAYALAVDSGHTTEAVAWLKKAAQGGNAEAQFNYAEANYKARWGVTQNYVEAWTWYLAASKQKNDKATFMLSRMSKYGEGVKPDLQQSVHWLQIASEQGNAQAMFLLSNAYADGDGIAKNPALAHEWLEKSADADFPVAIQALAMELEGKTNAQDNDKPRARHLLKEANDERKMRWNQYQ